MGFLKSLVQYVRVANGAVPPFKKHSEDAGFDLFTTEEVHGSVGDYIKIPAGIKVEIPRNHVGLLVARSSTFEIYGFIIPQGFGVIDSGYTGEIIVSAYFLKDACIAKNSRIAQLLIMPIMEGVALYEVNKLQDSDRGTGGFGSSGR